MTDDRSLERAARSWLDEGPTEAPDRPVEAALARIQTITQERDLRIPWRPRTMFDRLAVAAVIAVVAIGTFTLGASLVIKPHEPAAGACPREFSEADAVDTFAPGLSQAQRAWGIAGGRPARVRPGLIAAFASDAASGPLSVITIDPATGAQCRLLRFVEDKPVRNDRTPLDWSPSGDALAIGVENPEGQESQTAQVLIWTPGRLVRAWSGPGQIPSFEWAPDGRSMAVWTAIGAETTVNAKIIFADGSPDRIIEVQPWPGDLKWSPDGSRWIVGQISNPATSFARSSVATVDLTDGRVTPIDLGINFLTPVGWLDSGRALLLESESGVGPTRYLDVPVASPESFSVVPVPEDALKPDSFVVFSPDRRRVAYLATGGDVEIAGIAGGSSGTPVHIDAGGAGTFGLAWAPDGSRVVFRTNPPDPSASTPYTTWVVNADGTDLRQISVGSMWVNVDPWQPVPVR